MRPALHEAEQQRPRAAADVDDRVDLREVEALAEGSAEGERQGRRPRRWAALCGSAWDQSCAAAGAAVRIDSAVCRLASQIEARISREPPR